MLGVNAKLEVLQLKIVLTILCFWFPCGAYSCFVGYALHFTTRFDMSDVKLIINASSAYTAISWW